MSGWMLRWLDGKDGVRYVWKGLRKDGASIIFDVNV